MPTAKQIAANRLNAQKATGPRTSRGKAASRFNSLKHGIFATQQIIFDEAADDLAELAAEYHEHHCPPNPQERFLVDTLVAGEWRLRRMRRIEAKLWDIEEARSSGSVFVSKSSTFERLQRVVNSCERNYHRALTELQILQTLPPEAEPVAPQPEPASQPKHSTPGSAKLGSFRQSPQSPSLAAPNAAACLTQARNAIDQVSNYVLV